VRDLDLQVDREMERAAALGFDLGLVMGSSEVRATAIRRTTSAPPSKPPGRAWSYGCASAAPQLA